MTVDHPNAGGNVQPPNDFEIDHDRDIVLAIMAQTIEDTEASISITLTTAGTCITGMLVSSGQWFEGQQDMIASAGPGGAEMAAGWADLATVHRPYAGLDELGEAPIGPDYLHLVDAAICVPELLNARQSWRIHIASVSAWALGSFNKS